MGDAGSQLIFIGLMLAIFYFMLIRPQKRRVQAHQQLVRSIGVDDEVISAGGIVGTVRAVRDDELDVEIAPGTVVRILKTSISRLLTEDEPDDEDEEVEEAAVSDEDAG